MIKFSKFFMAIFLSPIKHREYRFKHLLVPNARRYVLLRLSKRFVLARP